MPQTVRIQNVAPSVRRESVLPSIVISSVHPVGVRRSFAGKGYPIGLLLALTYNQAQTEQTSTDKSRPVMRIL